MLSGVPLCSCGSHRTRLPGQDLFAATPKACRLRRGVFRLVSALVVTAASIHYQQEVHPMPSKTRNSSSTIATDEAQPTRKSSRGASVNRVILTGRLVATPELRTTGSGLHVTTVRIVTNDREQPEFHDVVLWR